MLRRFFGHRIGVGQSLCVRLTIAFRATEASFAGDASSHRQAELPLDGIDRILRHGAVGGPFSTQNANEAAFPVDFHFVLADQFPGFRSLALAYERTNADEASHNVVEGKRLGKEAIELLQEVFSLRAFYHQLIS